MSKSLIARVFESKRGMLNPAKGVKVIMAMLVVVLIALEEPQFTIPVLVGALFTAYNDMNQPDPIRVRVLCTASFVGALTFALGRAISPYSWEIPAPSIFLATLLAGFCGVYGQIVAVVAMLINVIFLTGLTMSGGPSIALETFVGFAVGGLITTFFLLLPWPPRRSPREQISEPAASQPAQSISRPLLAPFLTQFKFRTPIAIFSLVKTLGVTLAAAISWGLSFPYPQWAPTTTIITILPDPRMSFVAILQNVLGTLLGALSATVLILVLGQTILLVPIVALALLIGFMVKDINAGFFLFFMTNCLLLLLSFSEPGQISHIKVRLLETVIGAAIALLVELILIWLAKQQKKAA
jgi:uncharacterized membrane protein YccC